MGDINATAADCLDVLAHIEGNGYTPVSFDRLAELTGHPRQKLRRELATLESRQRVERTPAGTWLIARGSIFRLARCLSDIKSQKINLQETENALAGLIGVAVIGEAEQPSKPETGFGFQWPGRQN